MYSVAGWMEREAKGEALELIGADKVKGMVEGLAGLGEGLVGGRKSADAAASPEPRARPRSGRMRMSTRSRGTILTRSRRGASGAEKYIIPSSICRWLRKWFGYFRRSRGLRRLQTG